MSEPPRLDQQSEIVQLQTTVDVINREVRDIWDMLKEISERKFPWLTVLGVAAPILTVATGFSLQSILQVNLTAERIIQIQKDIEKNSSSMQKQYDIHTTEIKELKDRLDRMDKK